MLNDDWLDQCAPETMLLDGFEGCILGMCHTFDGEPIVAYDIDAVLKVLQDGGMSLEEAIEYFDYNILGAYMGPYTPCFVETGGR